jgi:hypothetical protein
MKPHHRHLQILCNKKSHGSKYLNRPSPPFPAACFKDKKKLGNNKKYWKSLPVARNKAYKWIQLDKIPKKPVKPVNKPVKPVKKPVKPVNKSVKKTCKNTRWLRAGWAIGKYSGTEPSPKGLGYCAKYEYVGTYRRGKDKNWWVKKSNGRWVRDKTYKPTLIDKIFK